MLSEVSLFSTSISDPDDLSIANPSSERNGKAECADRQKYKQGYHAKLL